MSVRWEVGRDRCERSGNGRRAGHRGYDHMLGPLDAVSLATEDRPDEPSDRGLVREDPDDVRPALDLPVHPPHYG